MVRILGDDGGVEEFSLLAVQLLLLTCKFRKFTVSKEKIEFKEDFSLIIKSFIYPIKYCEILGKILVDPSLSEEHNSDLVVTVLKDLRQPGKAPTVIQSSKKSASSTSEQGLLSIMKRW